MLRRLTDCFTACGRAARTSEPASGEVAVRAPAGTADAPAAGSGSPARAARMSMHGVDLLPRPRIRSAPASASASASALPQAEFKAKLAQWVRDSPPAEKASRSAASRAIQFAHQARSTELALEDGGLSSLPDCLTQLTALRRLSVSNNPDLQHLPPLPPYLTHLEADSNGLVDLPPWPPAIESIDVSENALQSLGTLPATVSRLTASSNPLSSLPPLPAGLRELILRHNDLESISAFPDGLTSADLSHNHLRTLPPFPEAMHTLKAFGNRLTRVPPLNRQMRHVDLSRNELTQLPAIDGPHLEFFSVIMNPISALPAQLNLGQRLSQLLILGTRLPAEALDRLRELGTTAGISILLDVPTRPALPVDAGAALAHSRHWEFDPNEEDAPAFNRFTHRLIEPAEYHGQATRLAYLARIDTLVKQMRASQPLRARCFELALEASDTCGDRVAMALNEMELARVDADAKDGKLDHAALVALGRGMFRLKVVDEFSHAKIARMQSQNEELEVKLAYQTILAEELSLPGVARRMLHADIGHVTPANRAAALAHVRAAEASPRLTQFMAHWTPWRNAMQRQHPEEFSALQREIDAQRSQLPVTEPPPGMTDMQWKQMFEDQASREKAALVALVQQLSASYLQA